MKSVSNFDLVSKAKQHHRRARRKDPALPAYEEGSGWVEANGSLKVGLLLVNGDLIYYSITPVTEWRVTYKATEAKLHYVNDKVVEATPADVVKHALDTALDVIADIEKRAARAAESRPDNVNITLN
jgi:hypothetical protein